MIALADISYPAPVLAASNPPYLTIATPGVIFYSHFLPTRPVQDLEQDAESNSHIRETFSPEPNGIYDYTPYIGPSIGQSDGTWAWDIAPSGYTPNVTAVDLKEERSTGRHAFYSGVLFGVAASALIQALSQALARRTERP
jgi:hypothetical protein